MNLSDTELPSYIECTCIACGKRFIRHRTQVQRGAGKHCSNACRYPKIERVCEACGRSFRVHPSKNTQKYCSRNCFAIGERGPNHYKWNSELSDERVCPICGKDFKLPQRMHPEDRNGTYCSVECRAKATTGQNSPRWKSNGKHEPYLREHIPGKRNAVRTHRLVAEKMIGRPLLPSEIVHHIDGNPQNADPSNLMVLTRKEHARIHRRIRNEGL